MSVFRRRPAARVGAAARAVAQRTPETLTVVLRRAQPTAVTNAPATHRMILAAA